MAEPHPALRSVATGRPVDAVERPDELFASAVDHRLSGLLANRKEIVEIMPDDDRFRLASIQTALWAQNTALLDRLGDLTSLASSVGVLAGAYKGVVTEQRWYSSVGERVVTDIDLLLDTRDVFKAVEYVGAVQSRHPLLKDLPELLDRGLIQSIDLRYQDVRVDVHFDPLKMELVPTRDIDQFWSSLEAVDLSGMEVLTPSSARTLVMTLLHTMRDRFRWLGAYADVVRLLSDPNLDWDEALRFADRQGYLSAVMFTLDRIDRVLGLAVPVALRSSLPLRLLWPERRALGGTPPITPPPRSTLKLALLARGRFVTALLAWLRRLLPPRKLLEHYYPDSTAPYLVRIVTARVSKRWSDHVLH